MLLWQADLIPGTTTYNVAQGSYGDFIIRFSGTALAGQTVALSDLGTVQLAWNGDSKVFVDVDFLSQMANQYGGFIEANSAAGGAFNFSVIIPAHAWQDALNVYTVKTTDKVFFKLTWSPTKISSGTVSISGNPKSGVHRYFHQILNQNVIAGGAQPVTDTINQPNIIELYLKDPSTALVSTIQITKDKVEKANDVTGVLLAYSNWQHLVESSGTFLVLEFAPSGNLHEADGQQVGYKYQFTGAATLQQYYSAIQYI